MSKSWMSRLRVAAAARLDASRTVEQGHAAAAGEVGCRGRAGRPASDDEYIERNLVGHGTHFGAVLARIFGRRVIGVDHERVETFAHDDAAHIGFRALAGIIGEEAETPVSPCASVTNLSPLTPSSLTSAPATGCAVESDVTEKRTRARSSIALSERSVTCARSQWRFFLVHGAQADEIGSRLSGAGDLGEFSREIEAELRVRAIAADRQIEKRRHGGRAERLYPRDDRRGLRRIRLAPMRRLIAGQRRRGGIPPSRRRSWGRARSRAPADRSRGCEYRRVS